MTRFISVNENVSPVVRKYIANINKAIGRFLSLEEVMDEKHVFTDIEETMFMVASLVAKAYEDKHAPKMTPEQSDELFRYMSLAIWSVHEGLQM